MSSYVPLHTFTVFVKRIIRISPKTETHTIAVWKLGGELVLPVSGPRNLHNVGHFKLILIEI
jgi:hypothetical protein